MNENISRLIITIFLFGTLLFIVGCSSNGETEPQDENITTIETVIRGNELLEVLEH